jgi:5'-methylthioadenosine phosphorylase
MTNLQEAKLAREAEIDYASVAMVTDYDCWHPHHDAVTVADVIAVLMQNAGNAAKTVAAAVAMIPEERNTKAKAALAHALMTDPKAVPAETREKLSLIVSKYLG